MKWLGCVVVVTAAVLLSGASATAALTGYATWNSGAASNPAWDAGDYPLWAPEPGLDWLVSLDGPANAVTGWPWVSPRRWPDSDGVGKWGGALKDDPGDGDLYVTLNNAMSPGDPLRPLVDAQGTVEFWFKPMWDPDPVLETNSHSVIKVTPIGLYIRWNGDGTMSSRFTTPAGPDVGHDWNSTALINDWNHIAFVWDATGNRSYANGNKVGEMIYGIDDPVVAWNNHAYLAFGEDSDSSTADQSDGEWDSLGIWSDARYTGPDYNVPTEEIPEPATLALLGLGGVAAIRRRRR